MVTIDPDKTANMRTPLGNKKYSENRLGYYMFGFNTIIKKATNLDVDNKIIYGIQLVERFHSLVLPIRLLDRKEESGSIFSKDSSYYAYLGKLVIGILYISVRTFNKNRIQIEYTYKYKVDGKAYSVAKNSLTDYASQRNISKKKAKVMSSAKTRKNVKDKHK